MEFLAAEFYIRKGGYIYSVGAKFEKIIDSDECVMCLIRLGLNFIPFPHNWRAVIARESLAIPKWNCFSLTVSTSLSEAYITKNHSMTLVSPRESCHNYWHPWGWTDSSSNVREDELLRTHTFLMINFLIKQRIQFNHYKYGFLIFDCQMGCNLQVEFSWRGSE